VAEGSEREIAPAGLEVAVLERDRVRRAFRRLQGLVLAGLLEQPSS